MSDHPAADPRDARPVLFTVCEAEYVIHQTRLHDATLAGVIAEAVADWRPGAQRHHQAVWRGDELAAVIRPAPDGTAEVVRLVAD